MSFMFNNCESLNNLPDISKWDTKNVANMNGMFYSCESLKKNQIFLNGILKMLLI